MSSGKRAVGGQANSWALDWAFDQRTGRASTNHLLIVMARRANKPPHHCFMSHQTMKQEAEQSLSTVGRGIKELKSGRYIREIPSIPRLKRLGIRTYLLVLDRKATGQNASTDTSICHDGTSQNDRENQKEHKGNQETAGTRRKSRKGDEAIRIGDLIFKMPSE